LLYNADNYVTMFNTKGCDFHDTTLTEGQTVTWSDGCTLCTCTNGGVTCNSDDCPIGKYRRTPNVATVMSI